MRFWTPFLTISGLVCAASNPLSAASLQAAPTSFEMSAGKAADTLTLSNTGTAPLTAQVRVYRWSQVDGEDKNEPTSEVVASPPMVTVAPGSDQIVRIVRVAKRPLGTEETYRIVADELPSRDAAKPVAVTFNFQYSIPLFLIPEQGGKGKIGWLVEKRGNATFLTASNMGTKRVRVGGLTVKTAAGKEFVVGKGLNGYVLAGSSKRWSIPSTLVLGSQGPLSISARSDEGPINAQAQAQAGASR
jgi:fimbrial chaperone protein